MQIPVVGKLTSKETSFKDIAMIAVSGAMIGIGSTPSGVLGAVGSLALGGIACKYVAPKGTANIAIAVLSIVNAVDLLMEGTATPRGVYG